MSLSQAVELTRFLMLLPRLASAEFHLRVCFLSSGIPQAWSPLPAATAVGPLSGGSADTSDYLPRAEEIVALARDVGATVCQLHAPVTLETLQRMKERAPDLSIIKSVVFHREDSAGTIDRALECAPWIDLFITDTFDPDTGASGATGKTHDWKLSAALVSRSPRPVILAGGLTPANVEEAIRVVRPAGVDVHTGVEDAAGHKDRGLVRAFVRAARRGLREISPDSP